MDHLENWLWEIEQLSSININIMEMEFKLLRKNRYNSKQEKIDHYSYLAKNDVQKYKNVLEEEYKDRFEVFKSWEILLRIIALFVLLLNAYFVGNLNAFILISGASLVFIIGALVFRRILIKNRRGYMLIQSIVDAACRGEIDFNDYS